MPDALVPVIKMDFNGIDVRPCVLGNVKIIFLNNPLMEQIDLLFVQLMLARLPEPLDIVQEKYIAVRHILFLGETNFSFLFYCYQFLICLYSRVQFFHPASNRCTVMLVVDFAFASLMSSIVFRGDLTCGKECRRTLRQVAQRRTCDGCHPAASTSERNLSSRFAGHQALGMS